MIFILDNYDSFTYNLVQRLGEIDPELEITVARNDKTSIAEIEAQHPTHLIISPGPCTPDEAGISVECAAHFAGRLPLLGVCLGHQSIGQAFGAKIVRAKRLMHGKTDRIGNDGSGLFAGMEKSIEATRYHSLVIAPETLPDDFLITAWSETSQGEQEIMGIRHRELPVFGLQFHPESFLTHAGFDLLRRFLAISS